METSSNQCSLFEMLIMAMQAVWPRSGARAGSQRIELRANHGTRRLLIAAQMMRTGAVRSGNGPRHCWLLAGQAQVLVHGGGLPPSRCAEVKRVYGCCIC